MSVRNNEIPITRHLTRQTLDVRWAIKYGLIGGIIAGVLFALMEMIYAWVAKGDFWGPIRMIASIPLQQPPPQIPLTTAIVTGLLSHMFFSMVFGVVVALIVSALAGASSMFRSPTAIVVFAALFGLLLWPVDFYVIAPLIGVPWFATQTNAFWQGFVAHTFFFGAVLGWYLTTKVQHV